MSSRRKSRKRSAAARSARPRPSTRAAAPASTGTAEGTGPAAGDGQGTDAAATAGSGPGAGRGDRKAGRETDRKKAAVAGNRTYAGADTRDTRETRGTRAAGGPARTPVGAGAAARTAPRSAALVAAAAPTAIGAATLTAPQVPFTAEVVTAPAPEAAPEPEPAAALEPAPYVSEAAPPAPAPIPALNLGLPDDATPGDAFDALYRHAAGALLRQVDLLTGDASQARRSVAYAYDLAWQRWPEVARDSDPVGWLRAAAYEHALAPWQRWVPAWAGRHRLRPRTPDDPLAAALLTLRPTQRKALLLHDGLGLELPAAAAEVEASEEAAAARIIAARETLTGAVPDLAEEALPARLGALLDGGAGPHSGPRSGPGPDSGSNSGSGAASSSGAASRTAAESPDLPDGVRAASERGARHRTVGAYALTAAIAAATTLAVILTPAHQSAHRARQSGPGAHAPARSGDRPGPAQHGGAGPLPSGKQTRAAVHH